MGLLCERGSQTLKPTQIWVFFVNTWVSFVNIWSSFVNSFVSCVNTWADRSSMPYIHTRDFLCERVSWTLNPKIWVSFVNMWVFSVNMWSCFLHVLCACILIPMYQSIDVFWFPCIKLFISIFPCILIPPYQSIHDRPPETEEMGKVHTLSFNFWWLFWFSCMLINLFLYSDSLVFWLIIYPMCWCWGYMYQNMRIHCVENTCTYVFSCSDTCILWEYMYSDTSVLHTWDPMCWEYLYQNTSEYKDRSILCPMYWIHGSLLWIHGSLLKIHVSLLFICGPLLWMYGSLLWIHGSLLRMHVSLLWIHVSLSLICGPLLVMYRSLLWIHGSLLWCKGRCIIPRILARNFLCEPFW